MSEVGELRRGARGVKAQPEPGRSPVAPGEHIERSILLVRGQKVMLDAELAALYGVSVKRLNEQVKRNPARFPAEFSFQLTREEYEVFKEHPDKGRRILEPRSSG